jgi:uncharacterized protein
MVYSAVLMGFIGSLHCLGMCGPLLMLLPNEPSNRLKFIFGRLLYNAGRIITYGILGSLIGLFGEQLSIFISQKFLSIGLGVGILAILFLPKILQKKLDLLSLSSKYISKIKNALGSILKNRGLSAQFMFGIVNGLLPCGLVYGALGGAFITSNSWSGFQFMILFGLGTVPMMLSIGLGINWFKRNFEFRLPNLISATYGFIAILLIIRGFVSIFPHYIPKNIDISNIPLCQ